MKNIINTKLNKNIKNIDKIEVDRFNTLANQWWNTNGVFKSLHDINTIRLDYILKYSNGLFGKTILDVGCGGGLLTEKMVQEGAHVTGLDISAHSLLVAQSHALSNNLTIHYILETIEKHALNHANCYDIVTCMEVLEHSPNPSSIINACSSVSKKGGLVFFSTVNRTFKSWLFVIIGAEYIFRIIPIGTHKFKKFITPSELLTWIDTTKLKEKNIMGMCYNPITNQCKLSNNIDMNYILYTQRI